MLKVIYFLKSIARTVFQFSFCIFLKHGLKCFYYLIILLSKFYLKVIIIQAVLQKYVLPQKLNIFMVIQLHSI